MTPCSKCATKCGIPPTQTYTSDGLTIVELTLAKAGTKMAQHSHVYEHLSFLARGAVRVHVPGSEDRDFKAPFGITIQANVKHQFTALADDTILLCIHNTSRSGGIETAEFATLEDL